MSTDPDALAEAARNRGLKLVRSRVRTPGKAGYGKLGLTDPQGEPVFGMEGKAPTEEPDAVAQYLRSAEVSDWKASLKAAGGRQAKSKPQSPDAAPKPARGRSGERVPKPQPKPQLREARAADAAQLARLFALLDHRIDAGQVAANLKLLEAQASPLLVIAEGEQVLGACGIASTLTPHRERPVGRVTVLVVAEGSRRKGHGRALVEEAERRLGALGCGLIEVTSNDRLREAHAFYRHLGYERTSMRFAKPLPPG